MPVASLPSGVRLCYEESGQDDRPAVVLVAPAGADRRAWTFQVDGLARHYRVITFDSRATGETEYPSEDFSIEELAADVRSLLDHLHVERAAVVGASMGACVALELAIRQPHRVWALVVAAATAGGKLATRPHDERLALVRAASALPSGERGAALARLYYGPRAYRSDPRAYDSIIRRAGWDADRAIEPENHPQNRAIAEYDVSNRVSRIRTPTLVLHGDDDVVVPTADGGRIADAIAGARFEVLPGGHLFFMQSASRFNSVVLAFLDDHAADARSEGWLARLRRGQGQP